MHRNTIAHTLRLHTLTPDGNATGASFTCRGLIGAVQEVNGAGTEDEPRDLGWTVLASGPRTDDEPLTQLTPHGDAVMESGNAPFPAFYATVFNTPEDLVVWAFEQAATSRYRLEAWAVVPDWAKVPVYEENTRVDGEQWVFEAVFLLDELTATIERDRRGDLTHTLGFRARSAPPDNQLRVIRVTDEAPPEPTPVRAT